jgi:hypothetical protein
MTDGCLVGKLLLAIAGVTGLGDLLVATFGMEYQSGILGAVAILGAIGGVLVHQYCPSAHAPPPITQVNSSTVPPGG